MATATHTQQNQLGQSFVPRCLPGLPRLYRSSRYDSWKAGLEFCLAAVMLVFASPVILLAAVLIKLTSRGPVLYCQTRLGRYGQPYTIFKLRTMRHNCEHQSGPCWSTSGDTRITPLGRFLRRTHIDELPQLWNVLRGDMSLVGPRPERPEFFPQLEEAIPLYRARLLVRPGVTGLAQVQLPPDTDLQSVRRKLAYDLYYVQVANPWLDLRLMFSTGFQAVMIPYAWVSKLSFLPHGSLVENAYEELVLTANHRDSEADIANEDEGVLGVEMATA